MKRKQIKQTMKLSRLSSCIFALSTLLVACNQHEEIIPVNPQDNTKDTPITIQTAGVAELMTRAGTPAGPLTTGSLSFYFNNESEDATKYVADCEKWTCTDGQWQLDETGKDTQQLLWKGAGNEIPWLATYPYRDHQYSHLISESGGMAETVPADQTDKTKWTEFDILWATGTATSSTVTIEFKHLYTKFSVNLTYGTEVDAAQTVEALTVGGTYTVRDFNYGTEKWGDYTTREIIDIKSLALEEPNYIDANDASKGTYNASFDALIIPQTAAPKLTIEMSDGRVFATTLTEQEFKSGYQYNIKLKVGQDKVELKGITAVPWGKPVEGGELETL